MRKLIATIIYLVATLPVAVLAQGTPGGRENAGTGGAQPGGRGNTGTGALPGGRENVGSTSPTGDLSYSLKNPLAFDSIQDFVVAVLNVIIVIATPIVVIFIILAGFKYVTARGNVNDIQEATKALTYAIIGGVLIIGAVAIAEIIKDLVTSFS
jgi:Type IV secretion system pilin